MQIRKAQRKNVRLRLALMGYGGSGKSYSALLLARGIVGDGRVLVIETEGAAIDYYDELTAFDVIDVEAPYTVEKFIDAVYLASKEGYSIVIIDSLSSEWSGRGGLLDMADKSGKKGLSKWMAPKSLHKDVLELLRQPPVDLICTFRAKPDNKQVEVNGQMTVVKEGDKIDSEYQTQYEFDILWQLDPDGHRAKPVKDRTLLFGQQPKALTVEDGKRIAEWRATAAPVALEGVYADTWVLDLLHSLGFDKTQWRGAIGKLIGKADPSSPTTRDKVVAHLEKLHADKGLSLPPKESE